MPAPADLDGRGDSSPGRAIRIALGYALLGCFLEHFEDFCQLARRYPDESGSPP